MQCTNVNCRRRSRRIEPSGFSSAALEDDLDLMSLLERRQWVKLENTRDYQGQRFPEPLPWPYSGAPRPQTPPAPARPPPRHPARLEQPLRNLPVPIQPAPAVALLTIDDNDDEVEITLGSRTVTVIMWKEDD